MDAEPDGAAVVVAVTLPVRDGDKVDDTLGADVPLSETLGVSLADALAERVGLRLTVPVRVLDPEGDRDVEGAGDGVEEGLTERDGDPDAVMEGDGEVEARTAPTDTTWACKAVPATVPSGTLL